jgi:hypothetical protein
LMGKGLGFCSFSLKKEEEEEEKFMAERKF